MESKENRENGKRLYEVRGYRNKLIATFDEKDKCYAHLMAASPMLLKATEILLDRYELERFVESGSVDYLEDRMCFLRDEIRGVKFSK